MPPFDTTYGHVRDALAGDPRSLQWVVSRFSPMLIAQARYRMGARLLGVVDPEDVVQDAWIVALPQLGGIEAKDGRITAVLVAFLSRITFNRIQTLLLKHVLDKPGKTPIEGSRTESPGVRLADDATGVVTAVIRREDTQRVLEAIEELEDADREILVLRGVEQRSSQEVATLLGVDRSVVYNRFSRATQRLAARFRDSVFAELDHPAG